MTQTKSQLSVAAWLEAAAKALQDRGPEALKAEALARELKTTKGSFYWHFKDVPDFHAKLLDRWVAWSAERLQSEMTLDEDAVTRLYRLARICAFSDAEDAMAGVEPAIRTWAYNSAAAAEAVSKVDAARLQFLDRILRDLNLTNPDFKRMIYATLVGLSATGQGHEDSQSAVSTLMAALLVMRDA